jgi:putative autotransporter adhesin-like protein
MRIHLLIVLFALGTAAPAQSATRNFGISSFTKIRVDGPYRVALATGVAPYAKAEGSAPALDRIAMEVRGDTLIVHPNPSWGGYPGSDVGSVQIRIGTHDLTSASLNGSGSLAIDQAKGLSFALNVQGSGAGEIGKVDVDQLNVRIVGTASGKLSGQAKKLTVLVRGVSALNAADLKITDASISADGSATIDANVDDSAEVNAWGPATVRLSGKPSCALKLAGSASVSGCKPQ